jgi:hypothetical protein
MKRKKSVDTVSLEYCFDRLIEKKLELVYDVLVPEIQKIISQKVDKPDIHWKINEYEDSSNLRQSILSTTKR